MKKSGILIASLFMVCAFNTPSFAAENEVKAEMKTMGKSFKAANQMDDVNALKAELLTLRSNVLNAQKLIPNHLKDQAADSDDRKLYAEGMSALIKEIDSTITLAEKGDFDATKAGLAKIKDIQSKYHKKLKP